MMRIEKDEFLRAIRAIKEQLEVDKKNLSAFQTLLSNDYVTGVKNVLYKCVIELLEQLTNDTEGWINYFIYDLEFGELSYRLRSFYKNKEDIPLSKVEDLWDLLVKNHKEACSNNSTFDK